MTSARQMNAKAGSIASLPFLLLTALLFLSDFSSAVEEKLVLTFQEFESSCIDLGHYDAEARKLTVRFVNRKSERFYRYSNVPRNVWVKLQSLNETGGVGNYLHETILGNSAKYPYEEVTLHSFTTVPRKKKAGDSK